jgi:TonB family protein
MTMSRCVGIISMLILGSLSAGCLSAEASSTHPVSGETPQSVRVNLFQPGPDVTAPELLPLEAKLTPPDRCLDHIDGKVSFSLIVDQAGMPRNVMLLRPLANDLDKVALLIVARDRFKPGSHGGSPVPVAQSLEVGIKTCVDETTGANGEKTFRTQLMSLPEQRLRNIPHSPAETIINLSEIPWKNTGGVTTLEGHQPGVSPPSTINHVEAHYTEEARKAKLNGVCVISLIVDPQGLPEEIHLVSGFDSGMDRNAMAAVGEYRFKPAMKDGEAIPVKITVTVNFRLLNQ